MVIEDGEGFITVEGEEGFEGLPFAVVDLDDESLCAAVVGAVGKCLDFVEDDDAAGAVVKFAAGAGAVGEE